MNQFQLFVKIPSMSKKERVFTFKEGIELTETLAEFKARLEIPNQGHLKQGFLKSKTIHRSNGIESISAEKKRKNIFTHY